MVLNFKPVTLSPDEIARVEESARFLTRIVPEIEKAEACGVDCSQHRAAVEVWSNNIEGIRKHYIQGSAAQLNQFG